MHTRRNKPTDYMLNLLFISMLLYEMLKQWWSTIQPILTPLPFTHWSQKGPWLQDVGTTCPGMGQAQQCGVVKSGNGKLIFPLW